MTGAAGFNEIGRINAGLRIRFGKHRVGRMAIGAPGNFFRKAEAVVLAMVALKIGFCRDVEDLVAGHHLLVTVAFHADFGMELPVLMAFGISKSLDVMQVMAIVAGSGIQASGSNSLAVNRFPVN